MSILSYGDRLDTFIGTKIADLIRRDLRELRLFSEMDMHAIVYYHLRKALGNRENWIVRCDVSIAGVRPDIVIFNRYEPKFVIEMSFNIRDYESWFPRVHLVKNREKLKQLKKSCRKLGKGYNIAVYDSREDCTVKKEEKWEKHFYKEIFINAQRMRNYESWKSDWVTIKSSQTL